jgi:uncharacterized protein
LTELRKPDRDPRDKFVAPIFHDEVRGVADVEAGMVTNVTKFGAFVFIRLHQDGLVHVSELSNRYIKDLSEAVKAGQIVKVKVMSVNTKAKRIALSIKAPPSSLPRPIASPAPKPPITLDERLAALSMKWKPRS